MGLMGTGVLGGPALLCTLTHPESELIGNEIARWIRIILTLSQDQSCKLPTVKSWSVKCEHVLNLSVRSTGLSYTRPSLWREFVLQQFSEFHSNFPGLSSQSLPLCLTLRVWHEYLQLYLPVQASVTVCVRVCACRRLETCCLNAFTHQRARPCLMMSVRVDMVGKHLKSVNTHVLMVWSSRCVCVCVCVCDWCGSGRVYSFLRSDSGWALYETGKERRQILMQKHWCTQRERGREVCELPD